MIREGKYKEDIKKILQEFRGSKNMTVEEVVNKIITANKEEEQWDKNWENEVERSKQEDRDRADAERY
ncbi:hypothetical protein ES705_08083 [subsurface metagenome]